MPTRYNPDKHHRRSIRLKGYDYTSAGAYFITICTHQRQCLFSEIIDGQLILNELGQIATNCWQAIPDHFPRIQLDEFIVMPNHIHGILVMMNDPCGGIALQCPDGNSQCPDGNSQYPHNNSQCPKNRQFGQMIPGSIPTVIRSFKSATTKHINILQNTPGTPIWQRNYYEHIIRDERALHNIRRYIQNNPLAWWQKQLRSDH